YHFDVFSRRTLPEPNRPIITCAGQNGLGWTKGDRPDDVAVSYQLAATLTTGNVPNAYRLIMASTGKVTPIRAKANGTCPCRVSSLRYPLLLFTAPRFVSAQELYASPRCSLPDAHASIITGAGDKCVVGAKCHTPDAVSMPCENAETFT